jgi:Mn2+/Fe2+ NRAMP family transporter
MRRGSLTTLIVAIYLAVGVIVANSHHYFRGMNDVKDFLSAILAVILWPLILLGIKLRIK